MDIKPSPSLAKQPVIIGGKPQKETYGEFEEEMNRPISPEEYKELLAEEQALQQENVELTYMALNQKLIDKAIKFCSKSFWWNFYKLDTKLDKISTVYKKFRDLQNL